MTVAMFHTSIWGWDDGSYVSYFNLGGGVKVAMFHTSIWGVG